MAPGNPLGAVVAFDGEVPRTFTAYAREAVSGGELVACSGATAVVGSDINSFAVTDLQVAKSASAYSVNGIALTTVGSNNATAVATRGDYLLKCGGSVFAGELVETIGDEVAVQTITSGAVPNGLYGNVLGAKAIGRAKTAGASGGFALVSLNL